MWKEREDRWASLRTRIAARGATDVYSAPTPAYEAPQEEAPMTTTAVEDRPRPKPQQRRKRRKHGR
jgi:hypothetical protein